MHQPYHRKGHMEDRQSTHHTYAVCPSRLPDGELEVAHCRGSAMGRHHHDTPSKSTMGCSELCKLSRRLDPPPQLEYAIQSTA